MVELVYNLSAEGVAIQRVAVSNCINGCLGNIVAKSTGKYGMVRWLNEMRVKGWKSIRDATIKFRPLNVVIGANGSGKSNLLSVFQLLEAMFRHESGFREYIGKSGGADSVLHFGKRQTPTAELTLGFDWDTDVFKKTYIARWAEAAQNTLIFTDERIEYWHRSDPRSPAVVSLGAGHGETKLCHHSIASEKCVSDLRQLVMGCRLFHFHDTSHNAPIRNPADVEANRFLHPDAGNLPAMLYLFQQKNSAALRRITAAARHVIPGFREFLLEPSRLNENQIHLKWFQEGHDYEFGSHHLSDGSIRFLALATLFSQPRELLPTLIALDEPELGLHPAALEVLAGMIQSTAMHCQVLVATQSPMFLDHFSADDVIVADTHQGDSDFKRLSEDELRDWLEDYTLSEVWEKNIVGGGPYG